MRQCGYYFLCFNAHFQHFAFEFGSTFPAGFWHSIVEMDTALLDLDGNEILLRAELLLLDVSNAVLKNVPEVTEPDPEVDDEAVRTLLKEGGHPPHQLVLPSIYATNQRVLEKLSVASALRIEFKELMILSARYGVRKDGSFLLIYPPSGCLKSANDPQTIRFPLTELEDKVARILQKNIKANSLRNYFVGSVDLYRSVDLKLSITDAAMKDWLDCIPTGSLRIELFGYLNPPGTVIRGELCAPQRFATATIPLGGLLGTAGLDMSVQSDLIADLSTKSLVASRMLNVSFGQRGKSLEPLGDKVGTLSMRVSVVKDKNAPSGSTFPSTAAALPLPLASEASSPVHSALGFVPSEVPAQSVSLGTLLDVTRLDGAHAACFALVLCSLEAFRVPVERLVEIKQCGSQPVLSVSFKTSPR